MMNESLISVIVPVYKVEKYLRQCVDSILDQTYKNIELILVDDGSPDNCPQICDDYTKTDNRVKVIHKRNGGQSSARNTALDVANGDYIAFVDSDDFISKDMLSVMMGTMLKEDCEIVMCSRTDIYAEYNKEYYFLPETKTYSHDEAMELILSDTIGSQPWDKLYKRDTYDGIKFPEGRIYEDIATTYLAFNRCQKFAYIHVPLYYYRMNEVGTSFSEKPNKIFNTFQSFYERLKFAEKTFPSSTEKCLALTFETAMGTINYHLRFHFKEEKRNLPIVDQFLNDYSDKIYSSAIISTPRKNLLRLYLSCRPLYKSIIWFAIKAKYVISK